MSATRLAQRYAKSLIDLAAEQGQLESVYGDVSYFNDTIKSNRDLWLLLKSPIVNTTKKLTILNQIFGDQFNVITNSFVNIVTKKRRESYLPEILKAFIEQYRDKKGIAAATLITAAGVNNSMIEQVKSIIYQQTGKKQVALETKVDPSLIGGFILQFDDKLFDSSISHKLDKLQKEFSQNKYVREF